MRRLDSRHSLRRGSKAACRLRRWQCLNGIRVASLRLPPLCAALEPSAGPARRRRRYPARNPGVCASDAAPRLPAPPLEQPVARHGAVPRPADEAEAGMRVPPGRHGSTLAPHSLSVGPEPLQSASRRRSSPSRQSPTSNRSIYNYIPHGLIPRVAISLARASVALALIQRRQGARRDLSGRCQREHRVSGVIDRAGFIKASHGEPLVHGTGLLAVSRSAFVLSGQCVKPQRNEACQCRAWVTSGVRSCSYGSSPPASGPSGQ